MSQGEWSFRSEKPLSGEVRVFFDPTVKALDPNRFPDVGISVSSGILTGVLDNLKEHRIHLSEDPRARWHWFLESGDGTFDRQVVRLVVRSSEQSDIRLEADGFFSFIRGETLVIGEAEKFLLFGLNETSVADYRTSKDRDFLESLHQLMPLLGADGWSREDRTIVTVTISRNGVIVETLRVDFFGDSVVVGHDGVNQLCGEIEEHDPHFQHLTGASVSDMASFTASWLKQEIQRFA